MRGFRTVSGIGRVNLGSYGDGFLFLAAEDAIDDKGAHEHTNGADYEVDVPGR